MKRYSLKVWANISVKSKSKILSSKYSQKFLDHVKQSARDADKTASKRKIQKTVANNWWFDRKKIANKITNVWRNALQNFPEPDENQTEIPNKRYISSGKINLLMI